MLTILEKLNKFLKLEIDRKFDNKAVVGGLEKAIPSWQEEAGYSELPQSFIHQVTHNLETYPSQSYEERARTVQFLIAYINDKKNLKPNSEEANTSLFHLNFHNHKSNLPNKVKRIA